MSLQQAHDPSQIHGVLIDRVVPRSSLEKIKIAGISKGPATVSSEKPAPAPAATPGWIGSGNHKGVNN